MLCKGPGFQGPESCKAFFYPARVEVGLWHSAGLCCCCCCQVASVVSDSVRPHTWQPTRLPHPWDSPDKNTGVDCHFLLQCMKVKSESEVPQLCPTLPKPMDYSHGIFQARVLEWVAIAFSAGLCMHCNFEYLLGSVDLSWLFSSKESTWQFTRVHPKASIPTLKPSTTQEPTRCRARQTMLILQQHRNTALSSKLQVAQTHAKPIDTPKLNTGHFIALQREEIQLQPQALLIRKL